MHNTISIWLPFVVWTYQQFTDSRPSGAHGRQFERRL